MANLTIFLALALVSVAYAAQVCPRHQAWYNCVSSCPEYCDQDPYAICTLECRQGCGCQSGFVLEAVDSYKCIPKAHCSRVPTCTLPNQEYRICGSACPRYCGQGDVYPCPAVCVTGCFCKQGYILASEDSTECILESECQA